jgi:hypothetical protein
MKTLVKKCPQCGKVNPIGLDNCTECQESLLFTAPTFEEEDQKQSPFPEIKTKEKPVGEHGMGATPNRTENTPILRPPVRPATQPQATRPVPVYQKPVTQSRPSPRPAATTPPVVLPRKFKTVTNLLSVFVPGFIFSLFIFIVMDSTGASFSSLSESLFTIVMMTLAYSALGAFYYLIAGGFEWKNKKLPVIRIILFWVLSDLILGLYYYGLWYLIRRIMAKAYRIRLPVAMGRLLATRQRY